MASSDGQFKDLSNDTKCNNAASLVAELSFDMCRVSGVIYLKTIVRNTALKLGEMLLHVIIIMQHAMKLKFGTDLTWNYKHISISRGRLPACSRRSAGTADARYGGT